ncbi:hypothetical protein [Halovivax gelatinilyticus]|uniref:hypothetical protein n=1 Tax=Halovivax gelatinilyticus TaxID=2961597 RepID=UPI0020CA6321|nr:hypothetical protein [Halovivax gelatinilyticus]
MSIEWDPLPAESLPPGWCLASRTPERLVYRCGESGLTLEAVRTAADHIHPTLGVTRCWELRLGYSIGECTGSDRLTRVSSRQELRAELESILETVGRRASITDPISIVRSIRD